MREYISKLCQYNHVSFEFLPFPFVVKDLQTGVPVMKGHNQDGFCKWTHRTWLLPNRS